MGLGMVEEYLNGHPHIQVICIGISSRVEGSRMSHAPAIAPYLGAFTALCGFFLFDLHRCLLFCYGYLFELLFELCLFEGSKRVDGPFEVCGIFFCASWMCYPLHALSNHLK
jgi:hypothetical protein